MTLGLVHILLPFMVLAVASTIETIDPTLEEAATMLGAPRSSVLRHIIVPLSLEGVATGALLVFTLSVGSFVTAVLLGDTGTMICRC